MTLTCTRCYPIRRAYDVHPIVTALLDDEAPFDEFQAKWAPSMVVGLGRLSGRTVGVLANNPLRLGGCLNSESAEKAARFERLCDAYGIPLVVIVDVPGYLPGVDQEWGGVVRRGAKLLHALGEATVPHVALVTRKIHGGAYIAMNSRSLNATKVFAAAAGAPRVPRMDNGPELGSQALQRFYDGKVGLTYIPPGCPWDSGYIESFNNRLRKECLNRNHWNTMFEARVVIGDFKDEHNHRHRHSALGYRTLAEYAAACRCTHTPVACRIN